MPTTTMKDSFSWATPLADVQDGFWTMVSWNWEKKGIPLELQ